MAPVDVVLPKQLAIYRQLVPMYHAIEALPRGPVVAPVLLKHKVLAERVAGGVTDCLNEPRFFEPLSEAEWREKGLRLADVAPADRLPDDPEFLATLPIANSFIRALTWEATDDGAPVFCMVGWDRVWYVLIIFASFLVVWLDAIRDGTSCTAFPSLQISHPRPCFCFT
jgi:hypothetical protein